MAAPFDATSDASFDPAHNILERFRDDAQGLVAKVRLTTGQVGLLKRFAPPAPPSFRAEVECLASVHSPYVTRILDAGVDARGAPWLLREFIDGETLRAALPCLSPGQRSQVARDVATGLAQLHREGLQHGDLKPENVLVPAEGPVRLTDFGFAGRTHASAIADLWKVAFWVRVAEAAPTKVTTSAEATAESTVA